MHYRLLQAGQEPRYFDLRGTFLHKVLQHTHISGHIEDLSTHPLAEKLPELTGEGRIEPNTLYLVDTLEHGAQELHVEYIDKIAYLTIGAQYACPLNTELFNEIRTSTATTLEMGPFILDVGEANTIMDFLEIHDYYQRPFQA